SPHTNTVHFRFLLFTPSLSLLLLCGMKRLNGVNEGEDSILRLSRAATATTRVVGDYVLLVSIKGRMAVMISEWYDDESGS
ncbi:hypothetical protein BJ165DRAFT_1515593, partial [Panaeolus papilionaceus]